MRSILATLTCLAVLASCSPQAPAPAQLQAVPVTIALLEETGRRCDALGQLVAARWKASAPLTATALEARAIVGLIVRQTGTRTTRGIAFLQQEAEIRIADLEGQRDPKAPYLRSFLREAREHCSAVTTPAADSLAAYARNLELQQADRDLALEEARQSDATPLSVDGNHQVAEIYNRIAALQEPQPSPRPTFERRAAGTPPTVPSASSEAKVPATSDVDAALKGLESALQGLVQAGAVPQNGILLLEPWSCRRAGGSIRVEGQVTNPGAAPIELGHVLANFSTSSGEPVATREAPFDTPRLASGQSSRFSLVLGDGPEVQTCSLAFTDRKGKNLRAIGDAVIRQGL
jgi:hypothetical protein